MQEKLFFLKSTKDIHEIPVYEWSDNDKAPVKGVIQLVHGSCEHAKRYEEFARFLVARGFVVVANDHRGHGKAVKDISELGYFAKENGWTKLVDDVYDVTTYIKKKYPDKKITMLGHSMGSFIVRHYAILYTDSIDALIVMGTAHHSKNILNLGTKIAERSIKKGKGKKVNRFLDKISYGSFHMRFLKEKDTLAWLSSDREIREAFRKDGYCGFKFTAQAFKDMFEGIAFITDEANVKRMNKKLPVLLVSGQNDPVGDYGKMVQKAYLLYKQVGMENVGMKLYPGMRHEILNETDKVEVYKDILKWIKEQT